MSSPRVSGLNHVTLAVGDLQRSVDFYCDVLGFEWRAQWPTGAYLEAGALWLCLSWDEQARTTPHADYTHLALDVAAKDFDLLSARVRGAAKIWKANRSEGRSLYFLDPDGHKLELHIGSLNTRLENYRDNPAPDRSVIDP